MIFPPLRKTLLSVSSTALNSGRLARSQSNWSVSRFMAWVSAVKSPLGMKYGITAAMRQSLENPRCSLGRERNSLFRARMARLSWVAWIGYVLSRLEEKED